MGSDSTIEARGSAGRLPRPPSRLVVADICGGLSWLAEGDDGRSSDPAGAAPASRSKSSSGAMPSTERGRGHLSTSGPVTTSRSTNRA